MPWSIVPDESRCPTSKPWGVVKDADDELEGCHVSQERAQAQLAALNAAEQENNMNDKQDLTNPRGLTARETLAVVQEDGLFTKDDASYTDPSPSEQRCGLCRFFITSDLACQVVEGPIAPQAVSDLYIPLVREQAGRRDGPSESKTTPSIATKVLDPEQGIVEHLITVFGILDDGGDISHPGSFAKTLFERGHKILVLDNHNYGSVLSVVAKPLRIREVSREELPLEVLKEFPEATGGVMAETQFLMDTPEGQGVFNRIKAGALKEWSYGYDALDKDFSKITVASVEHTVRNLRTIKLFEYSPVLWGMNPATMTMSAKGVNGAVNLPLASRDMAWDSTAAEQRVREWAGAEDEPNAKYRRAFFWFDSDNPDVFGSYKLGFADIRDGKLVAIPRGLFAVAGVLQGARGGADIPESDQEQIKGRVSSYYGKMRREFDDDSIVPPWEKGGKFDRDYASICRDCARQVYGKLWKLVMVSALEEPCKLCATLTKSLHEWPRCLTKAGRVISRRNATRISDAILSLVQMLADAGIEVQGFGKSEHEEDEKGVLLETEVQPINITINAPLTEEQIDSLAKEVARAFRFPNGGVVPAPTDKQLQQIIKDLGLTWPVYQESIKKEPTNAPDVQAAITEQPQAGPDIPPTSTTMLDIERLRLDLMEV